MGRQLSPYVLIIPEHLRLVIVVQLLHILIIIILLLSHDRIINLLLNLNLLSIHALVHLYRYRYSGLLFVI